MKIASVSSEKRGETDRLLSQLAGNLQGEGHQLAGIVKDESYEGTAANGCDMRVRVLSSGNIIQITQNLGAGSDACRLDPSAITEAVRQVEVEPLDGVELFVLNKFGPEECAGRGFCAVIGQAIEAGIPVLVGVGLASREKFEAFAGGLAEALPDEGTALKAWCQQAMLENAAAA